MSVQPVGETELSAWLDGEAAPERRETIERWLKTSPQAAARVESWRRQNDALRGRFARVAAEPLPDDLSPPASASGRGMTALPAADAPITIPSANSVRRQTRPSPFRFMLAAFFAGAAAVTVALVAFVHTQGHFRQPRYVPAAMTGDPYEAIASRAAEANRAFVRDASNPVEVWADNVPRLSQFLSRRVGLAISPPIFEAEGPRLLGGRVTPGESGPAALLVYEGGNGDRWGLYLAIAPDGGAAPMRIVERRFSAIAVWFAHGVAHGLVGPKDVSGLSAFAARVEAANPALASARAR